MLKSVMNARKLKDLFVSFFKDKGHIEIPSASLIPENDPTTLFISAGMHPLVPYLLGQPHPQGKRLVNVQKCLRTGDIDEVGDTYHHTFFEMLGNWSLGDYFKNDMIPWSYQFLTQILAINPNHLQTTCFQGDSDAPKDIESANIWQQQGIDSKKIHYLPKKDNWWGPAGTTGPCGPDTEMFIDTKHAQSQIDFKLGCQIGRYIEIWNDVFMQFNKTADGKFIPLSNPNVDTGMGVERTVAVLNGFSDNYQTSIWQPIIKSIEKLTKDRYIKNPKPFRIIADHLKASVFIISDGVEPSNKEAGYVLRRLIRKAVRTAKDLKIDTNFTVTIGQAVIDNQNNYAGIYPELDKNKQKILEVLETEETKFRKTLNRGLLVIKKLIDKNKNLTGQEAFDLYQSFGFPIELIEEELTKNNLKLNKSDFEKHRQIHIEKSRTLSKGKFSSGLADHSQIITKYHTATHILHTCLRQVLGDHVSQAGSNITQDRLRFDFIHSDKLTDDQIKKVEDLINKIIDKNLPVTVENMKFTDAKKSGALAFFGSKYPDVVSVYTIAGFSKEVCTGPHVSATGQIGKIKLIKQESAGSGKRRIYAKIA